MLGTIVMLGFGAESHSVVQNGLELTIPTKAGLRLSTIHLPQPANCSDYRPAPLQPGRGVLRPGDGFHDMLHCTET